MEETKQTADVVKSDFISTLKDVNKGQSPFELSAALDKIVAAVKKTGKAGTLTYKLTIAPIPKTENQVGVTDEIDMKLPKEDRYTSLFFTSPDNRLTRDDPNQGKFPESEGF